MFVGSKTSKFPVSMTLDLTQSLVAHVSRRCYRINEKNPGTLPDSTVLPLTPLQPFPLLFSTGGMTHGFALQVKVALVIRYHLKILLATEKHRASAESAGAFCSIIPFTAACSLAREIALMFSKFQTPRGWCQCGSVACQRGH